MSSYIVWVIIVCVSVGLVWGLKTRALREMTAKAEFYEKLCSLWRVIQNSNGGYPNSSPCVDEGFVYINNTPKIRRDCIRKKVYELLDSSYYNYLFMLKKEIDFRLAGDDFEKDKSLHILFVQNRRWLQLDEKECDWYGIASATFEPAKRRPNRTREVLMEEWDACEKRLAEKETAEKERLRKSKEERAQRRKGFWHCMANPFEQSEP